MNQAQTFAPGQVARRWGVNVAPSSAERQPAFCLPFGVRMASAGASHGQYRRVSSVKDTEAGYLNRPQAPMRGYGVVTVITEQASGLNQKRQDSADLWKTPPTWYESSPQVPRPGSLGLYRRSPGPLRGSRWKCGTARGTNAAEKLAPKTCRRLSRWSPQTPACESLPRAGAVRTPGARIVQQIGNS